MKIAEVMCEICGERGLGEDGWFVLMENRWTDPPENTGME